MGISPARLVKTPLGKAATGLDGMLLGLVFSAGT